MKADWKRSADPPTSASPAREKLIVTHAESRRMHGTEMLARPSRFLGEMPAELIDEVRPRVHVTRPLYAGRQRETSHRSKKPCR